MSAARGDAGQAAREARRITRELQALAEITAQLGVRRQELIRSLAADHGWSQREVAAAVGISHPRVSQIINDGRTAPDGVR